MTVPLTPTAGGYRFLLGGDPYSSGVVADGHHQIVRALLEKPVPWREGFRLVDQHLASVGRPCTALCAVELRSPVQFSFTGFAEFNAAYCAVLQDWGLYDEHGANPIARTNVVPLLGAIEEPSMYGFSYTVEDRTPRRRSFVTSGAGELRGDALSADAIVSKGDRTPAGMTQKVARVLETITDRLQRLGASWLETTTVDVYTAELMSTVLVDAMLPRSGFALIRGVRWYPSLPPIEGLEFEMDARGVWTEIVVAVS